MGDEVGREPARDPQDLERLLVSRERAGDGDGMAALYPPTRRRDMAMGHRSVLHCVTRRPGGLCRQRESQLRQYPGRAGIDAFPESGSCQKCAH